MKLKRHSSADIFPLLASFEKGVLSREDFCKQTKLKACSFSYWLKKYRQSKGFSTKSTTAAREARSCTSFVKIGTSAEILSGDYPMEIILRNGARIRFSTLVPAEYIQSILSVQ